MTLILNVPFSQKDEVKGMGARWNPNIKKWYVENREEYLKFAKWFSKSDDVNLIVCDHVFIIEASHECFKCGKKTKVIGVGIENYVTLDFSDCFGDTDTIESGLITEYYSTEINIISQIDPLPTKLLEFVQGKYNYKMRYSKFAGTTYLANCCDYCDTLQGDYYLFSEVDSPFFLDSIEKVSELKLYKIDLQYDIPVSANLSWSSTDHLIKKHGQMYAVDLSI